MFIYYLFIYLFIYLFTVFYVIFGFRMYNVNTYGTWQVFCIENWNTVQYVQHFLFFIQGEIWNLDHLVICGIPYANTYGILLQKIPRNSAKFRGIPYVFQKIPYSVGSQKRTSLDTLGSSSLWQYTNWEFL